MFSLRSLAAAALIPATTITAFADAPAAVPVKKSRTAAQMSTFTLMDENDFKWSDKYYTNAIQLAYTSPVLFQENSAPDWLAATLRFTPLAVSSSTTPAEYRFHFGIAQEMYTAKYSDRYPPPGDHPFAGLLYSSFGLSSETADRLDVLELSLGVIGPGSLARQTQNEYHDLIGDDRFRGWPNQLRNEPLVQLAWERRYRVPLHREESFGIDLIPLIHLEAGTVRSYATSGSHLRLGWNLPEDFGVDTLRSTNATFRPARNLPTTISGFRPDALYFYAGAQIEGWLHNSPLDGNLWHDSYSVDSYHCVGQSALGFVAHWGQWKLAFSEIIRSKEFRTQDRDYFIFHSVSLTAAF